MSCKHKIKKTNGQRFSRVMIRIINGENYWATAKRDNEESRSLASQEVLDSLSTDDENSLLNDTKCLVSFFQNPGGSEELKVREQLLKGWSLILYDSKPNNSLDDEPRKCHIIAVCSFLPNYKEGAYIGYMGVSDGTYNAKRYGKAAVKDRDVRPYRGNYLTVLLFFIIHKHSVDIMGHEGNIYLQTTENNPAKKVFKRQGFKNILDKPLPSQKDRQD